MRYYVLMEGQFPEVAPYILAEVLRERFDDGSLRGSSLASPLAGLGARILTGQELAESPEGRLALRSWAGADDASFDLETDLLADQDRRKPHLRLVEALREPAPAPPVGPAPPAGQDDAGS